MADSIYIAGPMRGHDDLNFPAFDRAADRLEAEGWRVVNPADLDRQAGIAISDCPPGEWTGFIRPIARRDLDALVVCDAIYMLRGWENSKGATAEHAVAKWLELGIYYE